MADAAPMALKPLWKGSELLHKLLADYLSGRIDTPLFCSNFEQAFNFDVDRGALTPVENRAFQRLFDEVVYFSPFPEERAEVTNYRSDEQILQAARAAEAELAAEAQRPLSTQSGQSAPRLLATVERQRRRSSASHLAVTLRAQTSLPASDTHR